MPELKARLVPPWMVYEGLRRALHWDRQAVVADKRYTSSLLRDQLVETTEAAIALAGLNTVLSIEQVPSEQRPELLLAHYVAWAVFQKCERGNPTGYDIVRARIVVGDVAGWQAVVWAENKETAWHPEGRYSPFETE